VFSAQALRTHQQHTLQSFKITFLSRNLDQNMHKNALFLKNSEKSPQHWGLCPQTPVGLRWLGTPPPDPRIVTLITCHSYFLEGVCNAYVITVKKEQKELRNNNNVLLLSFICHFKLCTVYPIKHHWLRFLGIVAITTYIISYLSDD